MNNLFGIGILLEVRDQISERLNRVTRTLEDTQDEAERTARSFNDLSDVMQEGNGFELTARESEALGRTLSGTSRDAEKFNRRMQSVAHTLGGEVPESTRRAYATMQMLNREVRTSGRSYGRYSQETIEARNRVNEFALGLNDATFRQIYMRSQLGLSTQQLNQQANSIKLNARMTRLMGNQTEILTRRMQGLQRAGVRPEMMLPPSTIGQFRMMNETMDLGISPLNRLSGGYRALGNRVEGVIKNYSAQKIAIRESNGDMVRYGLIMRSLQAGLMNFNMAFLAVGVSAMFFYGALFKGAIEADKGLQKLLETTKGKLSKAFEPLIKTAGQFLSMILKMVSAVADWMIALNQAHPVLGKILGIIEFLAPAMTMLLLPLGMGIGLWRGWMFVLNSVWTMIGGVVAMIGTASATFLTLAGVIGAVVWAFIYLMQTNETFRNTVTAIWNGLKSLATDVFTSISNAVKDVAKAFQDGGIEGGFNKINEIVANVITNLSASLPKFLETGIQMVTKFAEGISANLPKIQEKGKEILTKLIEGISSNISAIIDLALLIITTWASCFASNLSLILEMGTMLIQTLLEGLISAMPTIIEAVVGLLTTFLTVITENLPLLLEAGIQILNAIIEGIVQNLPIIIDAVTQIITAFTTFISQNLPLLLQAGMQILTSLIDGIVQNLPQILNCALQIILCLMGALMSNLPTLLMAGLQLVGAVAMGIVQSLPKIIACAIQLIGMMLTTLMSGVPKMLSAGGKLLMGVASGIIQFASKVPTAVGNAVKSGVDKDKSFISSFTSIGGDIIKGLANGIKSGIGVVTGAIKGVVDSAIKGAKSMLGIKSPSRVFKQIGAWTSEGMALGVEKDAPLVTRAIEDMGNNVVDIAHGIDVPKIKLGKSPRETVGSDQDTSARHVEVVNHFNIELKGDLGKSPRDFIEEMIQELKRNKELEDILAYK